MSSDALRRIFERIIDEMRKIQRMRMEAAGRQIDVSGDAAGRHRRADRCRHRAAYGLGFDVHRSTGVIHTVLGGVGGKEEFDLDVFELMEGVKEAHRISSPYKLASRSFKPGGTVVKIGDVDIGGERVVVMAGPCSVESREQIERSAEIVAPAARA
jgi:hypothetical protein